MRKKQGRNSAGHPVRVEYFYDFPGKIGAWKSRDLDGITAIGPISGLGFWENRVVVLRGKGHCPSDQSKQEKGVFSL